MASERKKVVLIGNEETYHEERDAAAGTSIYPSNLCATTTDGEVIEHATAGGAWEGLVAKEDYLNGEKTIDSVYTAGEPVMLHRCQKGDLIRLILLAGETVAMTDFLTSDGTGRVKTVTGTDVKLFKPKEALDLSGVGAVDTVIAGYVM